MKRFFFQAGPSGPDRVRAYLVCLLIAGNMSVAALAADAAGPATPPAEAAKAAGKPAADAAKAAESAKPAEDKKEEAAKPAEAKKEKAEEEPAPVELTPQQMFEGGDKTFNNWIEISGGGMIINGDNAQAEQRQHLNRGGFGGIQDLHFQQAIGTNKTVLTLDGHSIFGPDDYSLKLGVRKEGLGYVRVGVENFRTWYDTSGGYFAPNDMHFSLQDSAWELDRGQITFEAGLEQEKLPKVSFKYTHIYREGQKDSTIWAPVQTSYGLRGIYPGFYDIDENSDAFQLDATYKYKATTFGAGIRYDTGEMDNVYRTTYRPLELVRRDLTDRQGTEYDMLSVHAFTETWLKKNLMFSSGFLFANLDNTFSGGRIYGEDFDVGYVPSTLNTLGYFDLNGGSHKNEYVLNLNLMAVPLANVTIVPSIRVQKEDLDADSSGMGTLSDYDAVPFEAHSERDFLDVRERVDVRYTGLTNWVFYAGPELAQGAGDLSERGGIGRINDIGVASIGRQTEDTRIYQKYFAGVRWYPTTKISFDAGGYYKLNRYDYDHNFDSTFNGVGSPDRYPAFLVMQDAETYDANFRVTLRPVSRVTLVSRYEYQISTVTTTPDQVSEFDKVDSSEIRSHIFAQNASWTPWSRLTLQAGFNYVVSETETPTSDYTQAVLDARNNYWTVNFNAGFVVDDKTDLNAGYFYYESGNFDGDFTEGLPLGASAREHGITATIVRRISQNVRLNLKYGFAHMEDDASGGGNDYEAHVIYSSLQYRF